MRFYIVPFFLLLFVSSTLAGQSAPAPTAPEIISEDDLKLGIYDAPVFQPAVRNFTVRQAEGQAKDGEMLFAVGSDSTALRSFRRSPSFIRLHMECRPKTAKQDVLTVLFELLSYDTPPRQEVANND